MAGGPTRWNPETRQRLHGWAQGKQVMRSGDEQPQVTNGNLLLLLILLLLLYLLSSELTQSANTQA